jgi:hypothetical protein
MWEDYLSIRADMPSTPAIGDEVGAAPIRVPLDAPDRRGGRRLYAAAITTSRRPGPSLGAMSKGSPAFQPSGEVALQASVKVE